MFILLPVCALFTFLHLFTFAHLFFLLPFVPSLFFIVLFLYSHFYAHFFHRPQLYSSTRFIRRDYLLVCFSFHSSQSSRNVRSLALPPYFPRVVVIMLILFTLGWCPLSIMSSKILVFLSIHSQSTGGLNFKSHLPVFALLDPLITVAAIKRKSSLQVSAT